MVAPSLGSAAILLDFDCEQTIVRGLPVFAMSLHLVSWNVNGFHAFGTRGPRKLILRQELQPAMVGRLDMLLLQEHKLSSAHASRCRKILPGRSHTFWEPLIGEQARSGGVCTSVSESLS